MLNYLKTSVFGGIANQKLKVDLNLQAIIDYHKDDKNIALQLTWLGHAAFLLQSKYFL